jgi:predicted heme/steroid binding protein
LLCD